MMYYIQSSFPLFASLLQRAEMDEQLDGARGDPDFGMTLFLPSQNYWMSIAAESDNFSKLSFGAARHLVRSCLVGCSFTVDNMLDGDVYSSLSGQKIHVCKNRDDVTLTGSLNGNCAPVVIERADLLFSNGVVHLVTGFVNSAC